MDPPGGGPLDSENDVQNVLDCHQPANEGHHYEMDHFTASHTQSPASPIKNVIENPGQGRPKKSRSTPQNESTYYCPTCPKTFSRKSDIDRHVRIHQGVRPFQCHFCPKTFIQSSALTVHLRVHSGEKPFVCQQCQRAFGDTSSLARHIKSHSKTKSHTCSWPDCQHSFARKITLVKHILRVHNYETLKADGTAYRSLVNKPKSSSNKRRKKAVVQPLPPVEGSPTLSFDAAHSPSLSAQEVQNHPVEEMLSAGGSDTSAPSSTLNGLYFPPYSLGLPSSANPFFQRYEQIQQARYGNQQGTDDLNVRHMVKIEEKEVCSPGRNEALGMGRTDLGELGNGNLVGDDAREEGGSVGESARGAILQPLQDLVGEPSASRGPKRKRQPSLGLHLPYTVSRMSPYTALSPCPPISSSTTSTFEPSFPLRASSFGSTSAYSPTTPFSANSYEQLQFTQNQAFHAYSKPYSTGRTPSVGSSTGSGLPQSAIFSTSARTTSQSPGGSSYYSALDYAQIYPHLAQFSNSGQHPFYPAYMPAYPASTAASMSGAYGNQETYTSSISSRCASRAKWIP